MSKRRQSPDVLPPTKRLCLTGTSKPHGSHLSFDNLLYDELLLDIFSYLPWVDLCFTQSVSRNWARLAGDNELWRKLYIQEYGRSRLRGSRGFISRRDGREVRRLPERALNDQCKVWKWMFRISTNWRRGLLSYLNCRQRSTSTAVCLGRCLVEDSVPSILNLGSALSSPFCTSNRLSGDDRVHIVLAGPLTITASSHLSEQPTISISDQHCKQSTLLCEPSQPGPARITSLALDQAPPISGRLSLACFLSTGDIFVFSFSATNPSSPSESFVYRPSRPSSETITQAAYYRPLLVTLADPLSLSIYDLSDGRVRHAQTWTTFTCYSPASLVLSCPSTAQFKLVVTFATPVFPEHWTVGATEIIVSRVADMTLPSSNGSSVSIHPFMEEVRYLSVPTLAVMSARTIRAFDVQSGCIDAAALQAMRDQWGRKILNVAAAQTDGKWVILAPGGGRRVDDNSSFRQSPSSPTFQNSRSCTGLQLYRLVLPAHSNSVSASPPKLNFVRTLHGHTSAISAVALADGRCISLRENGSIWVGS